MKILQITTFIYLASLVASAPPSSPPLTDLAVRDASPLASYNALEKRKGGGGGKSGGSGGSSGGGSRSGGGSPSNGGRPYSYSPASNAGGRTRDGSGTPKAYGNRYTGGAVVPYPAGGASPTRGIFPYALPLAAVAFFPGLWLFPVFAYPYGYPYYWRENGENRTSNVTCLCQEYQVCGCDPTDNSTFLSEVVSNGTGGAPVNSSLVRTVTFENGTTATYINGSLENGTTADGGTDPSDDSQVSLGLRVAMSWGGYWVMVATVAAGMWLAA